MNRQPIEFSVLWAEALPWATWVHPDMKNFQLWDGIYQRYQLPAWAAERAARLPGLRLLALAEDWCGDAANSLPVIQRLVEAAPGGELRLLARDRYPAVMDRYLVNGSRSIPIVIRLDNEDDDVGHWGPRPAELQTWVLANLHTMPSAARYAEARKWYARDRGEATLRELLQAVDPGFAATA
ncbi:MAG: thioredoxin family protein [Gemmatimonadales bacterium]